MSGLSLPAAVPFSPIHPGPGNQPGYFWPCMVQFEQLKAESTSKRCQNETRLWASLPLAIVSHSTPGLCSPALQSPVSELAPVSKQEAQVPLPSFQQAWGRDTRELGAKQAELSQKILLPGTAQNESANHFVSSSALLSLLTPDPAALTGGISCRNSAARTSEDIIRAAVSRCHHCYLAGSHPGVSLCIKPNLGVSDC